MPTLKPACPKCHSKNVETVTVWHMGIDARGVTAPPVPMFACQEPLCLYKWGATIGR